MTVQVSAPSAFDRAHTHTSVEYLDMARAYPFVKWAGGKRALVPKIVKLLPPRFVRYWEPFVGGGAVFFALDSRIQSAYLSDVNLDLIITYKVIADGPERLIAELERHKARHSKSYYLKVRNGGGCES